MPCWLVSLVAEGMAAHWANYRRKGARRKGECDDTELTRRVGKTSASREAARGWGLGEWLQLLGQRPAQFSSNNYPTLAEFDIRVAAWVRRFSWVKKKKVELNTVKKLKWTMTGTQEFQGDTLEPDNVGERWCCHLRGDSKLKMSGDNVSWYGTSCGEISSILTFPLTRVRWRWKEDTTALSGPAI